MFTSYSGDDEKKFLSELIQFSVQVEKFKHSEHLPGFWQEHQLEVSSYSAQLMPLRERDTAAMDELFEREDVDEIAAEVNQKLLWLYPEPCWEEEPLDFLQDYL